MRFDLDRLIHLRRVAAERRAVSQAVAEAVTELADDLRNMERDRRQLEMNYDPERHPEAFEDRDNRIAAVRAKLSEIRGRQAELAAAGASAARTFTAALEFAREQGLDLPDDLRSRDFAPLAPNPQAPNREGR